MRRTTDRVRVAFRLIAERLVRLCIHPRTRSVFLRALGARIGSNVRIDEVMFINLSVGFCNLAIGDDAYLGSGTVIDLGAKVEIGSHTAISPGCVLITHSDPGSMLGSRLAARYPRNVSGIRIGDHTWIGASTTILEGVTIGDQVVIGAGALVTKDIPSQVVAYGVPAAPAKELAAIPE